MDLASKLPTMAAEALSTLQANALRLERTGTAAQQRAATELLPALSAEIMRRGPVKAAVAIVKPAAKTIVKAVVVRKRAVKQKESS